MTGPPRKNAPPGEDQGATIDEAGQPRDKKILQGTNKNTTPEPPVPSIEIGVAILDVGDVVIGRVESLPEHTSAERLIAHMVDGHDWVAVACPVDGRRQIWPTRIAGYHEVQDLISRHLAGRIENRKCENFDGTKSWIADRADGVYAYPIHHGQCTWIALDVDGESHGIPAPVCDSAADECLRLASDLGLRPFRVRSPSGTGWHVWVLLPRQIDARMAAWITTTIRRAVVDIVPEARIDPFPGGEGTARSGSPLALPFAGGREIEVASSFEPATLAAIDELEREWRRRRAAKDDRRRRREEVARRRAELYVAEGGSDPIARARAYLAAMGPAIEGSGGDAHTLRAAMVGGDLDIPPDTYFPILSEWNQICSPPWTEEDLRRKLKNADTYRQRPRGCLL